MSRKSIDWSASSTSYDLGQQIHISTFVSYGGSLGKYGWDFKIRKKMQMLTEVHSDSVVIQRGVIRTEIFRVCDSVMG